jgi:hypothetical protein
MILDLTGNGTLSVSVDNKPAAPLYFSVAFEFDDHTTKGFVPAVSIARGTSVRFVGFDE